MEFVPVHLIIIALVICFLIFVVVPLIDFAIGARNTAAKKARSARYKKAGIIFILSVGGIAAGSLGVTGYILDAFNLTFFIGAIVFLVMAMGTKDDRSAESPRK